MSNYGVKEVFDFTIYDTKGNKIFIDTVSKNSLSRDFETGMNVLIIEDALVDTKCITDILNGVYDGCLIVKANSIFRNLDGVDKNVDISITVAKMNNYNFKTVCGEVAYVTFKLLFPPKDCYGFDNFNITVD